MILGILKETFPGETRVAITPDTAKKLKTTYGLEVLIEADCGSQAGFPDSLYLDAGATVAAREQIVSRADLLPLIRKPLAADSSRMKPGAAVFAWMEPFKDDGTFTSLAQAKVSAFSMELIPRTSRAQSMDALSSQANIAGYRAVIEAAAHYPRFFPMMMTSAGSAKQVKVAVLGAGVAGLQAIATARRLGASVEAFDIRPEVKEQILSVGAKFMEIKLEESGTGQGGYAKALSDESQKQLQDALAERLKKFDVIITTANIPGRRAPVLVTEAAVQGMRPGSVIVDLAAENGGNCPLSEAGKVVVKHNVTLVGYTHYPAMVASDSSSFYAKNIANLLALILKKEKDQPTATLSIDLKDDILDAALVAHAGEVRYPRGKSH
jgi:NAD(P) transhydrogenase subunit alpha